MARNCHTQIIAFSLLVGLVDELDVTYDMHLTKLHQQGIDNPLLPKPIGAQSELFFSQGRWLVSQAPIGRH